MEELEERENRLDQDGGYTETRCLGDSFRFAPFLYFVLFVIPTAALNSVRLTEVE